MFISIFTIRCDPDFYILHVQKKQVEALGVKRSFCQTALLQMTLNKPTSDSRGLRFGSYVQMRSLIYNELEAIFNGKTTAKKGLSDAVKAGIKLLRQFEKANR